jgi:hypothetical protein
MIPMISREAIFGLQNLSYVSPEHNRRADTYNARVS